MNSKNNLICLIFVFFFFLNINLSKKTHNKKNHTKKLKHTSFPIDLTKNSKHDFSKHNLKKSGDKKKALKSYLSSSKFSGVSSKNGKLAIDLNYGHLRTHHILTMASLFGVDYNYLYVNRFAIRNYSQINGCALNCQLCYCTTFLCLIEKMHCLINKLNSLSHCNQGLHPNFRRKVLLMSLNGYLNFCQPYFKDVIIGMYWQIIVQW